MIHIYPTLAAGIGRLAGDRSMGTAKKYRALTKITRWLG